MRGRGNTTITEAPDLGLPDEDTGPAPGIVVIFANRRPCARVLRWEAAPLELGRVELAENDALDPAISRKHLRLAFDGSHWHVTDLGSRNGTFVQGETLTGSRTVGPGSVIRLGGVVLLAVADTTEFQRYGLGIRDGFVSGPSLRRAFETIAVSRRVDMLSSLLIAGESGTGKELGASHYHATGSNPRAPMVAVNCATIPKDLAERLLFGSRRGAFSGATDATGHVQAADGGTLFLDEVAELPLDVQTKLLRMLETREITRLGSTSSEKVDVRVCAATWRNLRREVAAGRFREDLYFRIGQPEVRLPPLRERVEEMPWHAEDVLASSGFPRPIELSAAFVEACALRPWPGNVRELRAEVRRCATAAIAQESKVLTPDLLSPHAGMRIVASEPAVSVAEFPKDEVANALAAESGNVLGAARRLGIHRNKVRRWLERHGVDPHWFKA